MSEQPGLLSRVDQTGVPLLLCRLALGGLFIWMGLVKARAPGDFLKLIYQYHMIPDSAWWLLNLTAATLPWVETCCGVLLVLGVALRGTALTLMAMLAVFTPAVLIRALGIYHAKAIAFCAIKFDCGCGAGEVYICSKLAENTALFLAAVLILISRSRRFCLRPRLIR
jgi:putative oxidoreductase